MRVLSIGLACLTLVAAASFAFLRFAPTFEWTQKFQERAGAFAHNKEIHFNGLRMVSDAEVQRQESFDWSVLKWLTNKSAVEESIKKHPLVHDVEVRSCGALSWGCFNIDVVERKPALSVKLGDDYWVVGDDGGFIVPLDSKQYTKGGSIAGRDIKQLPLLEGVALSKLSAERVKARCLRILEIIDSLEAETKKRVMRMRLDEGDEVTVKFREWKPDVTFEMSGDDWTKEGSAKLRRLVEKLGPDLARVERIDLAYNKVGVVRLVR